MKKLLIVLAGFLLFIVVIAIVNIYSPAVTNKNITNIHYFKGDLKIIENKMPIIIVDEDKGNDKNKDADKNKSNSYYIIKGQDKSFSEYLDYEIKTIIIKDTSNQDILNLSNRLEDKKISNYILDNDLNLNISANKDDSILANNLDKELIIEIKIEDNKNEKIFTSEPFKITKESVY